MLAVIKPKVRNIPSLWHFYSFKTFKFVGSIIQLLSDPIRPLQFRESLPFFFMSIIFFKTKLPSWKLLSQTLVLNLSDNFCFDAHSLTWSILLIYSTRLTELSIPSLLRSSSKFNEARLENLLLLVSLHRPPTSFAWVSPSWLNEEWCDRTIRYHESTLPKSLSLHPASSSFLIEWSYLLLLLVH